ncbi:alpha/beta hydrolase [Flavobacterium sp. XGLA_31]|uniref:alpha/beta hydrolase n=1 Tax=Flavobacterium sp. XGLA_31 TaxID=3447666 RepID=UPI003F2C6237
MKKIQFFLLTKTLGLYLNCLSFVNAEKAKSKAYKLFSTPRKGRLKKERMPKTLLFTTRETFEYEGEKIQTYLWQGDEKIILLVHGWESNASRWKKLLTHLKPLGHTIIAIDGPAHGLSDGTEFNTPKYAEFIHILTQKYQPHIVIGHSVGGVTLAYYLNKFKNPHIQKAVLLGAPSDFQIISNNFVALLSLNDRLKNLLETHCKERFNISVQEFSGHKFAENFHQKAFIAHDINDPVVKIDEGRKYAKAWKNATYIETQGLGHSMHDTVLYQKITDFISQA